MQQKFLQDLEPGAGHQLVLPDLIVHNPASSRYEDNLLVLEAKQGRVKEHERERDYRKLEGYLVQLNYQHAVFMEFDGIGGRRGCSG